MGKALEPNLRNATAICLLLKKIYFPENNLLYELIDLGSGACCPGWLYGLDGEWNDAEINSLTLCEYSPSFFSLERKGGGAQTA